MRISIVDRWNHKVGVRSWASRLFLLLLFTDICFFVLNLIALSGYWDTLYPDFYSNPYFIEVDRGYAEFFQYMKLLWCILLLGFIAIKKRSLLYLSWILLFLYLLIDDYAEVHEKLGLRLSNALEFIPWSGLRARDFGELLVSASAGLFFLVCIGIAYRLGDRVFRAISKTLIMLLIALAVCGVAMDFLHILANENFTHAFALLEDGGEMIVMSAATTFLFAIADSTSTEQRI